MMTISDGGPGEDREHSLGNISSTSSRLASSYERSNPPLEASNGLQKAGRQNGIVQDPFWIGWNKLVSRPHHRDHSLSALGGRSPVRSVKPGTSEDSVQRTPSLNVLETLSESHGDDDPQLRMNITVHREESGLRDLQHYSWNPESFIWYTLSISARDSSLPRMRRGTVSSPLQ